MPSPAALHGRGVFTTLAIYDSRPFLWERHWSRLTDHAGRVGLDISTYAETDVRSALDEVIRRNDVADGRARITVVDERSSPMWMYRSQRDTSLAIMTADARQPISKPALAVSKYPINETSPLTGIKTCNYLENFLVLDEARGDGFDEAVRLNHRGEVTSGCMANIFWVSNERLFTPPLSTGCLSGTTREFVLGSLECEERPGSVEDLRAANAIFLTSAGLGVVQVARFEDRDLRMTSHPITGLLPRRR